MSVHGIVGKRSQSGGGPCCGSCCGTDIDNTSELAGPRHDGGFQIGSSRIGGDRRGELHRGALVGIKLGKDRGQVLHERPDIGSVGWASVGFIRFCRCSRTRRWFRTNAQAIARRVQDGDAMRNGIRYHATGQNRLYIVPRKVHRVYHRGR
jgi:hypothetical protein